MAFCDKLVDEMAFRDYLVDAVLLTSRPAMARIFLEAGAATRPVPRGAGIRRTLTDPQVPLNFIGIV